MKKLSILLLAIALVCISAQSAPTLIIGSLYPLTNSTAYSSTNVFAVSASPSQLFSVSHSVIPGNNVTNLQLTIQGSADGINWTNMGSWNPSTTNAATEYIYAGTYQCTNYIRVAATATGGLTIGGSYGQ